VIDVDVGALRALEEDLVARLVAAVE